MLGPIHRLNDRGTALVIQAAHPDDRARIVSIRASSETLRSMVSDRWNSKIGEYVGLVHGNLRITSETTLEPIDAPTQGLLAAHACFMGVRRPVGKSPSGDRIAVYVIQAPYTYQFPDRSGVAVRTAAPARSVFTVEADFPEDGEAEIVFWEWVLAASDDATLPENHDARYVRRCWL